MYRDLSTCDRNHTVYTVEDRWVMRHDEIATYGWPFGGYSLWRRCWVPSTRSARSQWQTVPIMRNSKNNDRGVLCGNPRRDLHLLGALRLSHQERQLEPSCHGTLGAEGSGPEEKKRHYEEVQQKDLNGLDDEFTTLKFLSQEFQMRAQNIRLKRAS